MCTRRRSPSEKRSCWNGLQKSSEGVARSPEPPADLKALHAKIGELTLENNFLGHAQQGGFADRKAMIDRAHELPVARQAEIVNISRGSVYYLPRPASDRDLRLMRLIDELHIEHPFAGVRKLLDLLRQEGVHKLIVLVPAS